jgi:hypothetical protein
LKEDLSRVPDASNPEHLGRECCGDPTARGPLVGFLFALCLLASSVFFCTDPLRVVLYTAIATLGSRLVGGVRDGGGAALRVIGAIVLVVALAIVVPVDQVSTVYEAFDRYIVERFWSMALDVPFSLVLVAALAGVTLGALLPPRRLMAWALLGLILSWWWSGLSFDPSLYQLFATPPTQSSHDTTDALKTFYLLKQGQDYYAALWEGWRIKYLDVFGFRQPLLYSAWALLPGDGRSILYGYLCMASLCAVAAWDAARRQAGDPAGLLAAQLVLALYFKGLYSLFPTEHGLWAAALVMLATALLARERWSPAALCLLLAMLVREQMGLFLLPFLVVAWRLRRPRAVVAGLAALLSWAILFAVHAQRSAATVAAHGLSPESLQAGRLDGGLAFIARTLQFGGTAIAGHDLAMVVVLVGSLAVPFSLQSRSPVVEFMLGGLGLSLIAFLVMGTAANDYWGGLYLPTAFALFSMLFETPAGSQAVQPWTASGEAG